jgi:hypothetical protein
MTGSVTMRIGQFGRPTLSKDGRTMTVHIPITLRHQGGRKQVVTPAGGGRFNSALRLMPQTLSRKRQIGAGRSSRRLGFSWTQCLGIQVSSCQAPH